MKDKKLNRDSVFDDLQNLITESANPATEHIDTLDTEAILRLINAEDRKVAEVLAGEIPYIAQAVDVLVDAFRNGGRLFYIGAGTSGRLGVLDAAECPPTFGTSPDMIHGLIAGGRSALVRAQEGSEDDAGQGEHDLADAGFTKKDVACGIAASRRTPYVVAAIKKAREIGGKTIFISCNPRTQLDLKVGVAICPVVGPEVIAGSTRMKAGTATKLILNMLTTTAMIKLGKVYGNRMVDLQMTSRKLEERSKGTVMLVTGVDYDTANEVLQKADGHVKTALVMILANVDAATARQKLAAHDGFVRGAISDQ